MNKKKARSILANQKAKLVVVAEDDFTAWLSQTKSYLKEFLGEKSNEYYFLEHFTYYDVNGNILLRNNVIRLTNFLNDCIETLSNKGLFKEAKPNFLYHISNAALIPLIVLLLGAIGSAGFMLGNRSADVKNIELRLQVKDLQDSVRLARKELSDSIVGFKKQQQYTNKDTAEKKNTPK